LQLPLLPVATLLAVLKVRVVYIPFIGLRIWWITKNIRNIPIGDISWIYFFLYCAVTVILICYLLTTVEMYLLPNIAPKSPHIYGIGLSICATLWIIFPMVVITHWLFCSKRSWNQSIILLTYVALLAALWLIRSYVKLASMVFSFKNFAMVAAIVHFYPSFLAANTWALAASFFMAMSLTMMVLNKPTLESDTTSYYKYVMSSVGAGKYVGDVEYHCYGTTDFYGFQIRA
ncbi:unnamed protein product, partial [Allacma fusca]